MAKTWEEYKQYYIQNNGYNSNHIENPLLTKEEYEYYLIQKAMSNKEFDDKAEKVVKDGKLESKLIAQKETSNFAAAVNLLFENKIKEYDISILEKYNFELMNGLTSKALNPDHFSALKANGEGKVRTTELYKFIDGVQVQFMDAAKIRKDLDIINKRISKALSSETLSIKEKFNEILMYHLNFETIHPFGEGNGRTGRLIMDRQLFQIGLPSLNFKQENKDDIDYLYEIKETIMDQQYKFNRSLFYSVPADFLEFSWEQLLKQQEQLREKGFANLFSNINKIDCYEVIDDIKSKKEKINKDYENRERALSDEELLGIGD